MNCGNPECISCQVGSPVVCSVTARTIERSVIHRLAALVRSGINEGDLARLREAMNEAGLHEELRTAQRLVHAMVQVLEVQLDEEGKAA